MDAIRVERHEGLVEVTLDRPARKNAIDRATWAALDRVFTDVAKDPQARALVIGGAGGNFSAGADLSGDGAGEGLAGGPLQPIVQEMRIIGEIVIRLHRMTKPTVAKVDGVAVGVGLGLALACDLIVASDRARFCSIFAKRGLALDGGTSWLLPRRVGLAKAKEMALFADMVGAAEAEAIGLVNKVVPHEQLDAVASEWARRLASGPTLALGLTKKLLDASWTSTFEQSIEDEARCQHVTYTTADVNEGITAFLERREPRFQGR